MGSFAIIEAQFKGLFKLVKMGSIEEQTFITACDELIQNNAQYLSDIDDCLQMYGEVDEQ